MSETMTTDAASARVEVDDVIDWLVERLAERLAVPREQIDIREPLANYGLSSTQGVVLSGDLEEWLGRELPATLVWDHPTVEKLAVHLAGMGATQAWSR
jgi:acyl carrier protein